MLDLTRPRSTNPLRLQNEKENENKRSLEMSKIRSRGTNSTRSPRESRATDWLAFPKVL